jgi:nicotinamidase-related amidase
MKPALIVLDIQNAWIDTSPGLKSSVEKRASVVNEAISWFRRNGRPIIVVYHEEPEKGLVSGVKPFEVSDKIDIEPTDVKVVKRFPDAFGKTGLEDILKQKGCDAVVITGLSAGWCVLATYFGAMNWGIASYVFQGGVCADKEEYVRFAEEICNTTNIEDLEKALR